MEIRASLIIEVLGRPPEHIRETLEGLVTKLGSEKGVKVVGKTYHDPKPVENAKDLFTVFAEVDVELESIANYLAIIFTYMPAHIELINPEKIQLTNAELNELGNTLIQRLHNYDSLIKGVATERNLFAQKLQEVAPHLFKKPPQQPQEKQKTSKPAKKKTKKKSR